MDKKTYLIVIFFYRDKIHYFIVYSLKNYVTFLRLIWFLVERDAVDPEFNCDVTKI